MRNIDTFKLLIMIFHVNWDRNDKEVALGMLSLQKISPS